ncbi:PREDICTED: methyltransferase-like protein 16, partial [Mesitornis unicolor]|uniref:methyltransferase-like protein 16 n=1 Tax=Mesitornis unicolor TaxID=54374 RepID=UPI000528E345
MLPLYKPFYTIKHVGLFFWPIPPEQPSISPSPSQQLSERGVAAPPAAFRLLVRPRGAAVRAGSWAVRAVGGPAGGCLNFKDPEAVRALTCTLLKEDFGLTIDIPVERLIPTVPLRLNYIHWVEDLIGRQDAGKQVLRRGIDIGTGASCIYPLLGATLNGWYFLATEVDDMCFNYAKKNVEQNNLSDLIK